MCIQNIKHQVCNGYNLKTISIDVENVPFESPTKFRQVLILVNEPLQIDNSIYCENVDIHWNPVKCRNKMVSLMTELLFKPVIGKGNLQFLKNSSSVFKVKVLKMMKWSQPFFYNLICLRASERVNARANKTTKLTHILWMHTLYGLV